MSQWLKYLSGIVLTVLFSLTGLGQSVDTIYMDGDFLLKQNGWTTGRNASGLQYFPVNRFTMADVSLQKARGGFRNYYESDNSLSAGAQTQAWSRLNSKVVVSGGLSYNNFRGKNMTGSVLIDPYKNILGMDEYSNSNAGTKQLETYDANGAVSAAITSRFNIGGSVDFNAANYSKRKDLRHSNFLTNIDAGLGLGYRAGDMVELGVAYHYIRRIESLKFESFGNQDVQYMGFADFGLFVGRAELFGGNGSVGNGFIDYQKRPIVNQVHEVSAQLGLRFSPDTHWFNEFSYGKQKGYYGKKGSTQIMFTENAADQYRFTSTLSTGNNNNRYVASMNGAYETAENSANVYAEVTDAGNRSTIVYYGRNKITDRNITTAGLELTAFLNVQDNLPQWRVQVQGTHNRREQIVNSYPFFRKQDLKFNQLQLGIANNTAIKNGVFCFSLDMSYGRGSGNAATDDYYVTPDAGQAVPQTADIYLYQEFEYLTSPRYSLAPGIQFTVTHMQKMKPYAKLSDSYTAASDVKYIRNHFNVLNFSIGCYF